MARSILNAVATRVSPRPPPAPWIVASVLRSAHPSDVTRLGYLAWAACIGFAALHAGGCYRFHELADADRPDARASAPDGSVLPDAFVRPRDAASRACLVDESLRSGFADPPVTTSTPDPTLLTEGTRAADLRLADVIVAHEAVAGSHTVEAAGGSVTVRRGSIVIGSVAYDPRAAVTRGFVPTTSFLFPGVVELWVTGVVDGATLAGLPELFGGERALRVDLPSVIREGLVSGPFTVGAVELAGAPAGDYRFIGERGGTAITVELGGVVVGSTSYEWRATIGVGRTYVFRFDGLFSLEVGNTWPGTHNL